jgi:HSP20 family protein
MANITRFEPFGNLMNFDPFQRWDDFLRTPRMRSLTRDFPVEPEIKMDVSEDEKAYHVKAELPGVRKEDIHVAVDGNVVSISAEVKKEKEEKKSESVLRSERYYGMQSRSFTLMHEVDEGKAEAKCNNGILELTLPKKDGSVAKELRVQ